LGHPNDPLRDADEFTPHRVSEDVSPKTPFTTRFPQVVNERIIADALIDSDQEPKVGM